MEHQILIRTSIFRQEATLLRGLRPGWMVSLYITTPPSRSIEAPRSDALGDHRSLALTVLVRQGHSARILVLNH